MPMRVAAWLSCLLPRAGHPARRDSRQVTRVTLTNIETPFGDAGRHGGGTPSAASSRRRKAMALAEAPEGSGAVLCLRAALFGDDD
jgi:hypothetical protein